MQFDILNPKFGTTARALMYLISLFLTIGIAVFIGLILIDRVKQITFLSENARISAVLVILISALFVLTVAKLSKKLIDKSEIIGYIQILPTQIELSIHGSSSKLPLANIEYMRFKNSMGWNIASPDAYRVQIVTKTDGVIDIDYMQAEKNGQKIKYVLEQNNIRTRYWNS